MKRLHKVNEALKKYSHVNKKAFEQYNNFTKQRDTLMKRREELDSSQVSIEELIQVLDQRKDEAIERTFRQVSKDFAEIFEKLVPAGRGRLVIQRKVDRDMEPEDEGSDAEGEGRKGGVENYTGVGISVSFNSRHDEQQRIQQLSGGQKSLCALALIFAIQQCDPAPFYLFDEVDANLDGMYHPSSCYNSVVIDVRIQHNTELRWPKWSRTSHPELRTASSSARLSVPSWYKLRINITVCCTGIRRRVLMLSPKVRR